MTMQAKQFLSTIRQTEASMLQSLFSAMLSEYVTLPTWSYLIGTDNMDIEAGDAEDLPTVAQMDVLSNPGVAHKMQDISEAARVRRDLNVCDMTRTERLLSGIRILEARKHDLTYVPGGTGTTA